MPEPLWTPSSDRVANTQLTAYTHLLNKQFGLSLASPQELYQWSVDNIDTFWESMWEFSRLVHSRKYDSVRTGVEMFGTKWFEGARLNFAENLLRYRDDRTALIGQSEDGTSSQITYGDLYRRVACCAEGLKRLGVRKGDRVAGYITNIPEAIIAMLATTSIGAIWSSTSPDFGFKGVFDRFGQIKPKVLFTINSYQYNGRQFSALERINQLTREIPEIEKVVLIRSRDQRSISAVENAMTWEELLDSDATEIEFEQAPFDHPVYIMYSSGTTGIPKCIVHGAGGTLLQHYKEHVLHTDLRREDVITYFTTCGWMMWNWLVSALQVGSAIFLYDGSPSHPNLHVLWEAIEGEGISVFGTSPKFLSSCQNMGLEPGTDHDLSSLRAILSTGAPLSRDNFAWVYSDVKSDLQLSSISGGTDIISCFMLGNPNLPVYSGEIQCRGLGMKVETYNDKGESVVDEVGELVCTAPFVSMPVHFWNDPDGRKYHAAYFEDFQGVWRHGDYIKITPRGGVIVYGRSDATLNPGGVRIGTAEIYAPVEAMEEIEDSLVIEYKPNGDSRIVLFVVPSAGVALTDELRDKIRATIREQQTPRHVPAVILPITAVPHTLNGKKVEMAVARIMHGLDVPNRDALANPESLDQFRELRELLRM